MEAAENSPELALQQSESTPHSHPNIPEIQRNIFEVLGARLSFRLKCGTGQALTPAEKARHLETLRADVDPWIPQTLQDVEALIADIERGVRNPTRVPPAPLQVEAVPAESAPNGMSQFPATRFMTEALLPRFVAVVMRSATPLVSATRWLTKPTIRQSKEKEMRAREQYSPELVDDLRKMAMLELLHNVMPEKAKDTYATWEKVRQVPPNGQRIPDRMQS